MNNFEKSMTFVFRWEGGYVNDPKDPGGETKYGISKRWNPDLDIKNLTKEKAMEIYWQNYWIPAGCERLPMPLCTVVMDTAVNLGVERSAQFLAQTRDPERYIDLRMLYYLKRVEKRPVMVRFLNGWRNRIAALREFVKANTPK